MSLLSRAKDAILEKTLLGLVAPRIERYGRVKRLALDTTAKKVSAEIELLGETTPVTVSEASYRVEEDGDETQVVFYGVRISRPWAQNFLDDHFPEIKVKVPSSLKSLIG